MLQHTVKNMRHRSDSGFIFLEIIIATVLIGLVFIMLMGIGFSSLTVTGAIQKATQIDSLIKEELEAVRSFRDGTTWLTDGLGVANTGSTNPYYLELDTTVTPPKWKLVSGTETVGAFTRKVIFDKVSRDTATNNIESTYNIAHDDPDTRQVTVIIASTSNSASTYQVMQYLTNWNK